jgi:hypothetical protein
VQATVVALLPVTVKVTVPVGRPDPAVVAATAAVNEAA